MKISAMLLSFNRGKLVEETFYHNVGNRGRSWDELVWVDNGSEDGTADLIRERFDPDVFIQHRHNLGVSKGYNHAIAMCTGDWIMMMGDRNKMPMNWLKVMAEVAESGKVDAVCMWSCPYEGAKERHLPGPSLNIAGHVCAPSIAFGAALLISREMIRQAGYWREDLGMYGWNDVEWADRIRARRGRTYMLPDYLVTRAEDVNIPTRDGKDEITYRAWRDKEINDPAKHAKLAWCAKNNWPYYNPFV